mmetsp:Transcript_16199/g.19444  ORF Transcript_16199/g.19444 Transcript_16199/m.19444 type:complete len:590 (-) Transcript_16199:31-1800(-)|eukprot:CAMPEP_0197845276 /NCGR_PEP_ID=MMETSP1438-20131217/2211_1 /TAXON_ID=1461541 /ORGANISM="Pterosperma sp., Strain CCMP1384" /LENGTH=589 /DNA_ID=CAMNT_0043456503 /DNA_START=258 /DNA_END=2027 /DNA_ORIENTATION=+
MSDLTTENKTLRNVNTHLNDEINGLSEERDQARTEVEVLKREKEALEGLLAKLGQQLQEERRTWSLQRRSVRSNTFGGSSSKSQESSRANEASPKTTPKATPTTTPTASPAAKSARGPKNEYGVPISAARSPNVQNLRDAEPTRKPSLEGAVELNHPTCIVKTIAAKTGLSPESATSAATTPSESPSSVSTTPSKTSAAEAKGSKESKKKTVVVELQTPEKKSVNVLAPVKKDPVSPKTPPATPSGISSILAPVKTTAQTESDPAWLSPVDIWSPLPELRRNAMANNWLIQPNDIDLSSLDLSAPFERIGRGTRGDVFRGRLHGADVAVKKVLIKGQTQKHIQRFFRQVKLMSQIRSPHVVPFLGASLDPPDGCFLITQYMPNGNAHDWLHNNGGTPPPMEKRLQLAVQVATAMQCLQEMTPTLMHRDLKPSNVLIGPAGEAYVTDFELVREVPVSGPDIPPDVTGEAGTYIYMAPEVIEHRAYSASADMYSFGIMLAELVTAQVPYSDLNLTPIQVAYGVAQRGLRPTLPPSVPDDLQETIKGCWDTDVSKRPSFQHIAKELRVFQAMMRVDSTPAMPNRGRRWSIWS